MATCQATLAMPFVVLSLVVGASGLPDWPPPGARFVLNPDRFQSIPTGVCAGNTNAPCAIETIHQMVYAVAEALEAASTPSALDYVLSQINLGLRNQDVNFWPTIINSTGHVIATGAPEPIASFEGTYPYVGSAFQDVLLFESRHASSTLGGVFQDSVWADVQAAAAASPCTFNRLRPATSPAPKLLMIAHPASRPRD